MRTIRATLKFRVELCSYKPGMISQFYNFHQAIIRGTFADNDAFGFHTLAVLIIEFIAMAMTFEHNSFPIGLIGLTTRSEAANPVAQTHSTAFICDLALRIHQVNDGIRSLRVKFGTIRIMQSKHVASKLNDRNLHTQAETQVRFIRATGKVGSFNFTFDAPMTKAARYNNAVKGFQNFDITIAHIIQGFGVNQFDVDIDIIKPASVTEVLS